MYKKITSPQRVDKTTSPPHPFDSMLRGWDDRWMLCDLFSTFARAPSKDVRAKSMPPNIEARGCGGRVVLSPLWELVIFLYIYSSAVSILLASCVKQRRGRYLIKMKDPKI